MDRLATSIRNLRALGITDDVLGPVIADSFTMKELKSLHNIISKVIENKKTKIGKELIGQDIMSMTNDYVSFIKEFNKDREWKCRRHIIAVHRESKGKYDNLKNVSKIFKNKNLILWIAETVATHKDEYEHFYFYYGRGCYDSMSCALYGLKKESVKQKAARDRQAKKTEEKLKAKELKKIEKEKKLLETLKAKYEAK